MPPRLFHPSLLISPTSISHSSIPCFLLPFLNSSPASKPGLHTTSHRRLQPTAHAYASILSSLSDRPGAYSKRIRRGRGPSSGKGKTSGRGHGGQKQHGKVPVGFNGGQTPDEVVRGVKGEKNLFSVEMSTVNVDRIQSWIDQGRLDINKPITVKELHESRCLHGVKDGVKLLARNKEQLRSPIHITVSRASGSAIAAIEAAGGVVQTRYYTADSIKRVLKGLSHPTQSLLSPPSAFPSVFDAGTVHQAPAATGVADGEDSSQRPAPKLAPNFSYSLPPASTFRYRLPDATSRKDIEYYRDPAHRGYLSYQLAEGEGPSLFFKTPGISTAVSGKRGGAKILKEKGDNRIF